MERRTAAWGVGAIVAVALAVRLWTLGSESLWADEAYSLNVASRSLAGVLADHDQTPPLYVLLLHAWLQVAGASEWAVRLPSALFGAAAVALVYPVATRFGDRRAALLATALAALSLYNVVESQEARAYSLFLLLSLASVHQMLRLSEAWTRGRAAAYVACTVLLLYSHVYALFFLLAQQLYAFLCVAPDPAWRRRWLACQALVAVGFAPWLGILAQRTSHVASGFWLTPPGPGQFLWTAVVLAGSRLMALLLLLGLLAAAMLWWRDRAAADSDRMPIRRSAWPWAWLTVPVLLPFLLSQRLPIYTPKYVLPSSIPLLVLASSAAIRLRRPLAAVAAAGLLLAASAGLALFFAHGKQQDWGQDWRGAAQLVDGRAGPGEVVLFNTGYCDSTRNDDLQCAYERYSNRTDLRLVPFLAHDVPVNATNIPQLDPILAGQQRVWVIHGFPTDPDGLIGQRLARDFTPAGHWEPKHLAVDEWVRTPAGTAALRS